MADLENLFNSPPGPPPRRSLPPDSPPTPAAGPTRSANPLFLSPGSAIDSPRRPAPQQRRARSPAFDPTDDLDGPAAYGQNDRFGRAPSIPSGQRPRAISLGPGPIDDADDVLDPFAALRNGDGDEDGVPKKRRVMAKVDADRLTGDDGILKLMKAAKRFKVKGKGREADDLKELLSVYQMWAHGMFPKGDFVGTMQRVEVVCRTKRMESALKGYREAFYPRPRTPTPPPRQSRSRSPTSRPRTKTPSPARSRSRSREDSADATAAFGMKEKEPLFSARENGDEEEEDGPDLDELLAMEEMEDTSSGPAQNGNGVAAQAEEAAPNGELEEEDEWEGLYD